MKGENPYLKPIRKSEFEEPLPLLYVQRSKIWQQRRMMHVTLKLEGVNSCEN
jgi:hypothetical protein